MKLTRDYKLVYLAFALTLTLLVTGTPVAAASTDAAELAQLLKERNPAPSSPNTDSARKIFPHKQTKKIGSSGVNSISKAPQLTTKGKVQIPVKASRIAGATTDERIKNALATAGAPMKRRAAGDADDHLSYKRGQGMKDTQKAGLEHLLAATAGKGGIKFAMDKHGVPSHLAGVDIGAELPEASDADGKRGRAKDFLRSNKELLQIADPDNELHLKREERDSLGKSHYRFQQTFQGIPVYGRESLVHLDDDGKIYLFQGHHLPTPTLPDVTPIITRDEALAACATDLGKSIGPTPQSELVVYYNEPDETNYLAWHIDAYPTTSEAWRYFVDAKTGKIITKYSTIMNGAVPASGIDLNDVRQDFTAWQSGSTYYCYDVTRPYNDSSTWAGIPTARGDIQIYDGRYTGNTIPVSSSLTTGWDPAAISVVSNIYKVLDYYQTTHQRIGIDGNAGHVKAVIHQGDAAGNAYWNGSYLAFGDDQSPLLKLPGSLDVVAHEMAHGITQYTADLEYQNQSGALNESMSDFFAAMVDRDDWLIGEDVYWGTIKHLRDMRNPHNADDPQPATMSEYIYDGGDHGGVHANSGIPNRAAYLVAEGLSAEGQGTSIGKDKTEKIWYRALTLYLSKYSTFWHARWATEQAASDLFGQGSPEMAAIQAGWDAVGVSDSSSEITNAPTSADPIIGEDRLVYVWDGGIYEQDSAGMVSGPFNDWVARDARPAVYYGTDDTLVFYVATGSYELWMASLNSGTNILVDDTIEWWSLAASPDNNYIAFTKNIAEPYIYIYDGQSVTSFALYNPTTGTNSQDSSTIEYPDALSFDYRSRYVIYDYLNSIPSNLGTDEFWRIGILDIRDGSITVPVTDSNPDLHVGNPVFAANNDYIIALDLFDTTTNASAVVTLNVSNGKAGLVFNPDLDGLNRAEFGWPAFRGDDNAISMQSVQTVCPFYCYEERKIISVPLTVESDGSWSGIGASAVYLTSADGQYPVMYRAGTRLIDAHLVPSATTVNFGTVAVDKATKTITLNNTGNVDLFISNAAVTGAGFTFSGTLGRLPRNTTMPITIALDSTGLSGARTGSLTITSDADTPTLTIPISATIQPRYKLSVNKSGTGTGNVSANTGTLAWVGSLGTANYFNGTIVNLTVLPASGSIFTGWGGACSGSGDCTVTMNTAQSVTATFAAPLDTTPPTITAFDLPTTSSSLTVSITSLSATDDVGVTGYLLSESATSPQPDNPAWTSTSPTSYTLAAQGDKSIYAFTKDAAGNVSAPLSAIVTITLPDTVAPTLTAFALPATATSLTVPVLVITANDNVAITGYFLSESALTPLPADPVWTSTPPGSYTFSTEGSKTLYAFARDAAGNISGSAIAATTITLPALPDITAPTVTAFTLPATSNSLTVAISSFTASDIVGVTGYCLAATNSSNVCTWSATAPSSYTFTMVGSKTLYAFAKDAAGNVSNSTSAGTTITLPTVPYGDLDNDGITTSADALPALQMAIGKKTIDLKADVAPLINGVPAPDGKVTAADALVILRKAVGLW